jgi:hexulose-6-phosphate isomerase
MHRIAIMQGRLLPPNLGPFPLFPRERWREEFPLAAEARLDGIEWIYDLYGRDVNPLSSDAGLAEMRQLGERHGIAVDSVCANYYMDRSLFRAGERKRKELAGKLLWLIERCRRARARRLILPFVDRAPIETARDEDLLVEMLAGALLAAAAARVDILLETSLGPAQFAALLERLPAPCLKVNYDSGNSGSLGYCPTEEFRAYGARVGGVHIKDRLRGGPTVPLGTGGCDFRVLFRALAGAGYQGDFTLEAERGQTGDEVALAGANRRFVQEQLREAACES